MKRMGLAAAVVLVLAVGLLSAVLLPVRAADPPGAADARAIARAFLTGLVDRVTDAELAAAGVARRDDHAHGPTLVLTTPRFAVRVALATREVVAFSRCAQCLPLGDLEARCAPSSALLPRATIDERALAFVAGRFPGLRWDGHATSRPRSHHSMDERSFHGEVGRRTPGRAWVEVTLSSSTAEVTAVRRSPTPPAEPTEPVTILGEQARARALAALAELGHEPEADTRRAAPALVTLRDPATGEPRRYWSLQVTLRGHRGGPCACAGGEDVTVLVDAVTGRPEVVR